MLIKFLLLCVAMITGYSKSIDPRPRVNFPLEVNDKIVEVVRNCLTEYNMDPKVMEEIRNGEYRTDVTYQKFIHCSYSKSGFTREDGHVLAEDAVKIFPAKFNIGPIMKKCDNLSTGEAPFEITFSFFKCFQETSPVLMALSPLSQ